MSSVGKVKALRALGDSQVQPLREQPVARVHRTHPLRFGRHNQLDSGARQPRWVGGWVVVGEGGCGGGIHQLHASRQKGSARVCLLRKCRGCTSSTETPRIAGHKWVGLLANRLHW